MSNFPCSEESETDKLTDMELSRSELQNVVAIWETDRETFSELFSEASLVSSQVGGKYSCEDSESKPHRECDNVRMVDGEEDSTIIKVEEIEVRNLRDEEDVLPNNVSNAVRQDEGNILSKNTSKEPEIEAPLDPGFEKWIKKMERWIKK